MVDDGAQWSERSMETMGRQAEVEARAWRPEVKLEESHTKAELETEKSAAKQET